MADAAVAFRMRRLGVVVPLRVTAGAGVVAACFFVVPATAETRRVRLTAAAGRFAGLVAAAEPTLRGFGFSPAVFLAGAFTAASVTGCPFVVFARFGVRAGAWCVIRFDASAAAGGVTGLAVFTAVCFFAGVVAATAGALDGVRFARVCRLTGLASTFAALATARCFAGFVPVFTPRTGASIATAAGAGDISERFASGCFVALRVFADIARVFGWVLAALPRERWVVLADAVAVVTSPVDGKVAAGVDCFVRLPLPGAELAAGAPPGKGVVAIWAASPAVDVRRVLFRTGWVAADGLCVGPVGVAGAMTAGVAVAEDAVARARRTGVTVAIGTSVAVLARMRREGSRSGSSAAGSVQPRTRCGVSPSATPTRI